MSVVVPIDKVKVSQSFSSAAKTYDELATLQRKVGLNLLSQIDLFEVGKVVDIGCGTGFLTQEMIQKGFVREMIAVDIALSMLQLTQVKLSQNSAVKFVCADAEFLPLIDRSIDTIVSNLALQWCQNLTAVFRGFNRVLNQKGQLYFSTFGPATLQELKKSWAEVDDFSHVNQFYSADEIMFFLQQAGFYSIKIESKRYVSNYRSVLELMRELKGIGAHNVLPGRNRNTTSKTKMKEMIEWYEEYSVNGLIPATYEIFFVSAKV